MRAQARCLAACLFASWAAAFSAQAASFEIQADAIERRGEDALIATGNVRILRYPSQRLVRWQAVPIAKDQLRVWLLLETSPQRERASRLLEWKQTAEGWRIVREAPWHKPWPARRDPEAEAIIEPFLRGWIRAWNRRNLDAYLGFYAPKVWPEGFRNRAQWIAQLEAQMQAPPLETIEADRAVYRIREGVVKLEGHLHIRSSRGEGWADRGTVHLRDPYAVLVRARWRLPDGRRLAAERIVRQSEERIEAEALVFSSCPPEEDAWRLRAASGVLDLAKMRFSARNARLEIGPVPVLFAPYWSQALTRRSGLLLPRFGGSSRTGTRIALPWYWAPRADWDATITPEWLGKRGAMLGLELRHAAHGGGFALQGETIRDRVQKRRRARAFGEGRLRLPSGWQGSLALDWVSDSDYLADFVPDRAQAAYTVSQVELLRQLTYGSALIRARWQQNLAQPALQAQTLQTLPAAGLHLELPWTATISLALDAEADRFWRRVGDRGLRLRAQPELRWRKTSHAGALGFDAAIGMASVQWRLQGARRAQLFAWTASAGARVALERFYGSMRHEVASTIRIDWVQAPEQTRLPRFDSSYAPFGWSTIGARNRFVGGDRIERTRRINWQLDSRWQTKDATGIIHTPLSVSIAMAWSLRQPITDAVLEPSPPPAVFPLLLRLRLIPAQWIAFDYDARIELRKRYAQSEQFSLALGTEDLGMRLSRFVVDARAGAASDAIEASLHASWKRWRLRGDVLYDRVRRLWTQRKAEASYQHPCWRISLAAFEFLRPSQLGAQRNRGVRLLLEMNGLGSLGG